MSSAATVDNGAFSVQRSIVEINQDGSMNVVISYANAVTGAQVAVRTRVVPAQSGNASSQSIPADMVTALNTFLAKVDAWISSDASAGKLNL